jgi:hypothetical protein
VRAQRAMESGPLEERVKELLKLKKKELEAQCRELDLPTDGLKVCCPPPGSAIAVPRFTAFLAG